MCRMKLLCCYCHQEVQLQCYAPSCSPTPLLLPAWKENLRDTPGPQPAPGHGATAHSCLAVPIWPMACAPPSKARALLSCGAGAVVWGHVQSLTGLWAHQGLKVPKARGCSRPLPVCSAVEWVPGAALCDTGAFCVRALGDVECCGAWRPL